MCRRMKRLSFIPVRWSFHACATCFFVKEYGLYRAEEADQWAQSLRATCPWGRRIHAWGVDASGGTWRAAAFLRMLLKPPAIFKLPGSESANSARSLSSNGARCSRPAALVALSLLTRYPSGNRIRQSRNRLRLTVSFWSQRRSRSAASEKMASGDQSASDIHLFNWKGRGLPLPQRNCRAKNGYGRVVSSRVYWLTGSRWPIAAMSLRRRSGSGSDIDCARYSHIRRTTRRRRHQKAQQACRRRLGARGSGAE